MCLAITARQQTEDSQEALSIIKIPGNFQ